MTFFPRLLATFALAGLGAVRAQDLQAGVTIDPQAGLATYNIRVQGPPNGICLPAASLLLSPPLPIPGMLGNLLIDPLLLMPLPLLPLSPTGQCQLPIPVPLPLANGLPVMFQAVVVDPAHQNQPALTDVGAACPVFRPANPNLPALALHQGVDNGNVTVNFALGPAGGNVMILVNGGQKAQGFLVLGPNGQGATTVAVPGGIQPGDTVTVLVDGVPVTSHRY